MQSKIRSPLTVSTGSRRAVKPLKLSARRITFASECGSVSSVDNHAASVFRTVAFSGPAKPSLSAYASVLVKSLSRHRP